MKPIKALRNIKPATFLGIAAFFFVIFLAVRNTGVYATTMWDEWEYDRYSRLLPLAKADVPYYLYFFVFGITKFFGTHFLFAAQILNSLFYAASMPFIYLVGRSIVSEK